MRKQKFKYWKWRCPEYCNFRSGHTEFAVLNYENIVMNIFHYVCNLLFLKTDYYSQTILIFEWLTVSICFNIDGRSERNSSRLNLVTDHELIVGSIGISLHGKKAAGCEAGSGRINKSPWLQTVYVIFIFGVLQDDVFIISSVVAHVFFAFLRFSFCLFLDFFHTGWDKILDIK